MFCCGNNNAAISTVIQRNKEPEDEISVDKPAPKNHLKCVMVTGGGKKTLYA